MQVKTKIMLVVLPVVVATAVLVGISSFYAATSGITRVTTEFLQFKAQQLSTYAQGQWDLLVENELQHREEMRRAAQRGVAAYARSIVERDSELILAVDLDGNLTMNTHAVELSADESEQLAALAARDERDLLQLTIDGVERVGAGFYFEPFEVYYVVSEERAVFFAETDRMARQTLLILLVSIAAAIAVLFTLSSFLTRPLNRVVRAMSDIIATGDLSSRVEVEYRDEIGALSHTFNLMTNELQRAYEQIKSYAFDAVLSQKKEQRIRQIFQKYVPQDLISRFFENPEEMLVGDNRQLAILFSDIRGFTGISEHMRPDELVNALNRYFSYMVDVILEQHGIVDKYIGDAIMAFFGAPLARGDEPDRAIRAALGMIAALDSFNAEQRESGNAPFMIGIGVSFGEVTVGNIGTERKMDYTVIGDAANVASRLESLTKEYGVALLVTENVREQSSLEIPWRLVDTVAVKGRSAGVRLYTTEPDPDPHRRDHWHRHNRAMELYYAKHFGEATEEFRELLRSDPTDHLAERMLERALICSREDPGPEWTGVEVMTMK